MRKADAFQNLKNQRATSRGMEASNSHQLNDKYMHDFELAWEELQALQVGKPNSDHTSRPSTDNASSSGPRPMSKGQRGVPPPALLRSARSSSTSLACATPNSQPIVPRWPAEIAEAWRSGPQDPSGRLLDLSDRPSMCLAAAWQRGEVVVGSSDHAVYVVDVTTGRKKRTLYNRTLGHTEWVTCVAVCPDGKIVSGGMDNNLWLWQASGVAGACLEGHSAAVSKVRAGWSSSLVASSSYDKTVRLWITSGRSGSQASCLHGHKAPVLELDCAGDGRMVSGDRSGNIILWDTSTETASWQLHAAHKGHVTALAWMDTGDGSAHIFVSGGQDGTLCIWDTRCHVAVKKMPLHVNEAGHGAIGDVLPGGTAAAGRIVTSGADGTLRVLDPAAGYSEAAKIRLTDFPYSLAAAGGLALCGCGDGSLHVVDIAAGQTLYALGAGKAAVRAIEADAHRLVTTGDDGNVVIYDF